MKGNNNRASRDANVAAHLRARRRRRNQRRRARRSARRVQNATGPRRGLRPLARAEHFRAADDEEKMVRVAPDALRDVSDILSDTMLRYCECVTNPFGNQALGAILPDRFQEVVIPAIDVLELDITPADFNSAEFGDNWLTDTFTSGGQIQLVGAIFWFQPRCMSAGVLRSQSASLSPVAYPWEANPDVDGAAQNYVVTNLYNLCMTGVWELRTGVITENSNTENFSGRVCGLYHSRTDTGGLTYPYVEGYRIIPYARFPALVSNFDGLRVLGAGLKIWSEEAPINTGGYCVGGWITIADVYSPFENAINVAGSSILVHQTLARNQSRLSTYQQKLKGRCRQPGLEGSTTRYSSLQTPDQIEKEIAQMSDSDFVRAQSIGGFMNHNGAALEPEPAIDASVYDVATPSTYVPAIYWQFNVDTSGSTTLEGLYTLKLMSMVHSEGVPTGTCPFMSRSVEPDPMVDNVKMMLDNWDTFPPAVKGHSFKSFMHKANHILGQATKFAGHTANILNLISRYVGGTM